jgi:hypothetical protein
MRIDRRPLIVLGTLLIGLSCLSGCESGGHFSFCGYTTQPTFDTSIRTVYVPLPENLTYYRDIEFELHKAVVRELGTSPYRVTSDCSRADTELLLKIVRHRKTVINLNQLGETRDAELTFHIEVVWRDLRPGRGGDILSNPKRFDAEVLPLPGEAPPIAPKAIPLLVTPVGSYVPEVGGSNLSAERQAVTRAAVQIVNMMEVWPR